MDVITKKMPMYLQFFGGRGASSGIDWLKNEGGNSNKPPQEIDISQFGSNYTIEDAERRIRNLDHEELFVFDKDDKLIAAYKGSKTSVSFPADLLNLDGATITHGHPKGIADFGGTFSFADMRNMLNSNWAEHRATASGQGEMNYILRRGKNARSKAFYKKLNSDQQRLLKDVKDTFNSTYKETIKAGKSKKEADHIARQKSVGVLNAYYKKTAEKYGYEYITRKEDYKYNR